MIRQRSKVGTLAIASAMEKAHSLFFQLLGATVGGVPSSLPFHVSYSFSHTCYGMFLGIFTIAPKCSFFVPLFRYLFLVPCLFGLAHPFPAPRPLPRVKLAILLEGLCSRLANHHLAIPFLRPFLPGIASPLEKEELPAAPGKVGKGGAVPETPASETLPGGADESEDDPVGFDAEPAPANMRHRGEGGGAVCFQGGGVQAVTGVTSPPSNLAVSAGGDHGEAQRAVGGEGGRTRKRSLPSTAASKAGASRVTKAVPPPSPPGAAVGPVGGESSGGR